MVLHESKYDQSGSAAEFLPLAMTPLCNSELFPDAYSTAAEMNDGAFPMPLFAFGDSDEDDMEEDNFDDMEEEDFDDDEEDDEDDDEDDEDDEDDFDDDDYDYDDDEEFEYDEE